MGIFNTTKQKVRKTVEEKSKTFFEKLNYLRSY